MPKKVLYIMSSYNLCGGTPKKTLELMEYFGENASLYIYHDFYPKFKSRYLKTGGSIYEGFFGRNIFKHIRKLIRIVDKEGIDIVQTQFSMGETLGYLIKLFRPNIKLVVAFVGALKPTFFKHQIVSIFYKKVDLFIAISNFVKEERIKQYPFLEEKNIEVVYNGTKPRESRGTIEIGMEKNALLAVSSLIEIKNIQVLISAIKILIKKYKYEDIHLYIAGEGAYRPVLENLIKENKVEDQVHLLGNQTDVGTLLEQSDIFVHPSYMEGFGIAVAEAMHAGKPIIVSDAGALPELIENKKTGLVVDPYNAEQWCKAIISLIENPDIAKTFAKAARRKAEAEFSFNKFVKSYEKLYESLHDNKTFVSVI